MALYVAICLLAALVAVSDGHAAQGRTAFAIIWGTTLGLAAAHWLAFRVSALLVGAGTVRSHDVAAASAQLAGAFAVAVLATLPLVILGRSVELDAARLVIAAFIALVGYRVARESGATTGRSVVYAAVLLLLATMVAAAKNALSGH